jgi:Bacterial Ig-like domain
VAEEEQIKLSWKANTESDLKGYTIQYGTSINNLNLKTFITKPGSSKTITGLTGDTTYYFALIAEDRSGNKSKSSNQVNATPKAKPSVKLVSSVPKNGATDVGTGLEVISFTYSKAVKRDTFKVKCANFTEEQCNTDLATLLGTGSWSDADKTVTFKPTRTLERQTKYAMLLEGKDSGNRNLEKTEISFTTATAPVPLRYVPPSSAKGIPDGAYIYMVFSKKMNMQSLQAAFSGSVNSRDGTQTRPLQLLRVEEAPSSQGGFAYSFVPSEKYGDGTVVTWSVAVTAMDVDGSRLLQAVADGFTILQRLTVTIPVDPKLTGHVTRYCLRLTGCRNNEILGGPLAGYEKQPSDVISENEYVLRGFIGFSYDNGLFPENPQFVKASLRLQNTSLEGEPFAPGNLSKLALQRVNLGSKLNADDFDTPFLPCYAGQPCSFSFYGPPDPIDGPVDVLNYFQADWADRATRGYHSHFRLRFANNKPDTGRKVTQVVRYATNPTLTIEYLAP